MSKTVLTRKELSERWGVDISTLETYEKEGYIKRLNLPGAKFSLCSIEKIEYDGIETLLQKKDRKIRELESQILDYKTLIEKVNILLTSI